eukprot:COSAG02_NODE_1653_length_11488_cov_66.480815_6_plen_115_part_00
MVSLLAWFFLSCSRVSIDFLKMLKGEAPSMDNEPATDEAETKAGWDVLQEDYGMKHTSLKHWNDEDDDEEQSEEEQQAEFDSDDDSDKEEEEEEEEEESEDEEEEESEDEDEVE